MPALLALFGWGRIAGQAVAGWLSRRSLAEIGCIALAVFAGLQTLRYHAEKRESAKLEVQLTHCSSARHADALAYAAAQKAAQADNRAQVQKIEQQQQKVTADVEARYRADLARLRAERGKLQQTNPAPSSPPGSSGPSQAGPTPGGPHGEAVPLPSDELLRAQETELQLNALIDWVLSQSKVDPNAK